MLNCKQKPTYNPFDTVYHVSVRELVKKGCDTISAGCGYFNLMEKNPTSKMYYQIYMDDFFQVVAKGYVYHLDTFDLETGKDAAKTRAYNDSLRRLPFDISLLNEVIGKYSYRYLDTRDVTVRIVNEIEQDTVGLSLDFSWSQYPRYLVRSLEYFWVPEFSK